MHCSLRKNLHDLWQWILKDPRIIVRVSVLFACSVIVIFQLSECFWKLINPPITTHSHFDLNKTMAYPAVTFCRDPPYKEEVMSKYNLAFHPRYVNRWKKFPFNTTTLTELFNEATYSREEFFYQYGLNGSETDVEITSSIHFQMGQCHTVKPLVITQKAWRDAGYSIMLRHTMTDISETSSEIPPGWHVFIHEPSENFTESRMQSSGRVEYMYVEVGEQIEVKLTVQHFATIPNNENTCAKDIQHSSTKCGEMCLWRRVSGPVGCTGPWMPDIELPQCVDQNSTVALINNYVQHLQANEDDSVCGCDEPCDSIIYSAFVMNRKEMGHARPSAQLYMYFTSKMVTIIQERPGYDLSQFVADMGGSLGFLLGLSVLGLIGILEKLSVLIFGNFKSKNSSTENQDGVTSERSASTVAVGDQKKPPTPVHS